jgi:hypothetical protein
MKRAPFILIGAALFAANSCFARPPQSPQDFLRELYAQYAQDNNLDINPMGDEADQLLTPSLLALLRKEQKVAPGDGDDLDMNPVCDCQDYRAFKPAAITIIEQTATGVRAEVKFDNAGPVTVGYALVKSGDRWRIDDISDPDMPSFRAWLKADTRHQH